MIDPGASADELGAVTPAADGGGFLADAYRCPRRAETLDSEAAAKPQDPEDPAPPRTPVPKSAQPLGAAWRAAARAHRFEIAPAFHAIADMDRLIKRQMLPLDSYARFARQISRITASTYTSSAALSLPRLNIAERILPTIRVDLGFHQTLEKMTTSWDLGLLERDQRLAMNMTGLLAPQQKLIRDIGGLGARTGIAAVAKPLNFTAMGAMTSLVDLFRQWREIAEFGAGLLRGVARVAYLAALHARAAVLRGDNEPVAQFIENWLHMPVTPERIEAVCAALLEKGWDTKVPDDPDQLLADLRRRSGRQARVLRPIWETQLNLRSVRMLDQPIFTSTGLLCTVADLVRDPQTTEDAVLANTREHEQRLHRVLDRLKPDELTVTNIYAQRDKLTWAEAAHIAGAADPAAMGERVRRKLKRLGAEHQRRLTLQPAGA